LLSIGSGETELRATQPWLDELVYDPLVRREGRVLHHELHPGPGVDVAGDLTDPAFLEHLGRLGIRSVMCCNVLEHVPEPRRIAAAIEAAVPPGGYAVVTVPSRFPYHPGPLDTMFRPRPEELRELFSGLEVVDASEIRCESLAAYFLRSRTKRLSLARGVRSLRSRGPADDAAPAIPLRDRARMALLSTAVSAVVLRASP